MASKCRCYVNDVELYNQRLKGQITTTICGGLLNTKHQTKHRDLRPYQTQVKYSNWIETTRLRLFTNLQIQYFDLATGPRPHLGYLTRGEPWAGRAMPDCVNQPHPPRTRDLDGVDGNKTRINNRYPLKRNENLKK